VTSLSATTWRAAKNDDSRGAATPASSPIFSTISPDNRLIAYAWFNAEKFYELRIMALVRLRAQDSVSAMRRPASCSLAPGLPTASRSSTPFFSQGQQQSDCAARCCGWYRASAQVLETGFIRAKWTCPPTGRYIVYDETGSEEAPTSNLYVLASDGSRESVLVNDAGNNLFPVWMRDGKSILFASDREGAMALWSIAVRDWKAARRAATQSGGTWGASSPMGITSSGDYYYGLRAGEIEVCIADIGTGKPAVQPVLTASDAPEWSPDGRRLAMLTWVGAENFGQESRVISIVSPESGESRALAPKLAYPRTGSGGRRMDGSCSPAAATAPPVEAFTAWTPRRAQPRR